MRKPRTTAATVVLTPVTNIHPLDQATNDELLDAYIAVTARFVKAMGYDSDEWRLVQVWARKTRHGYTDAIRVSVNNEYLGETNRPMLK